MYYTFYMYKVWSFQHIEHIARKLHQYVFTHDDKFMYYIVYFTC